jgi:Family of unknown function (DUF6186)
MTRALAITVYALAISGAVLVGRRRTSTVPSVEELWSLVMSTRTGRVCTVAFWSWIGWHFFCR